MKWNNPYVTAVVLAAAAVVSCVEVTPLKPVSEKAAYTASMEGLSSGDTKTALADESDVVWSENDRIMIFEGDDSGKAFVITDESVGLAVGDFVRVDGEGTEGSGSDIDAKVAVYPYDEDVAVEYVDYMTWALTGVNFPSEQLYRENGFGESAAPMVALNTEMGNNLQFLNVGGLIRFALTGVKKVSRITLAGNNGELLSGDATVTFGNYMYPTVGMDSDASTEVSLVCDPAVQLDLMTPVSFYIAVPPTEFENGFSVVVDYSDGDSHTLSTDKYNSVERSKSLWMPECDDSSSLYDLVMVNSISHSDDYYLYLSDNGNSYIYYNLTANISGDPSAVFDDILDCGIYVYDNLNDHYYIWTQGLSAPFDDTDVDFGIGISPGMMDNVDYDNYYAEASIYSFGVYVQLADSTYWTFNDKQCKFVYSKKPSYTYQSVGPMTVTASDSTYVGNNGEIITEYRAEHSCAYTIDGVLWIESVQGLINSDSNWVFSSTGEPYENPWWPEWDGKREITRGVGYNSSSISMYHEVYQQIVTITGETLYSNSLIYDGTILNPTVEIGDSPSVSASSMKRLSLCRTSGVTDYASGGYVHDEVLKKILSERPSVRSIDELPVLPL